MAGSSGEGALMMEQEVFFFGEKMFGASYFAMLAIAIYLVKQWMAKKESEISELFRRVNNCLDKDGCDKLEKMLCRKIDVAKALAGRHYHDEQGRVIQRWTD